MRTQINAVQRCADPFGAGSPDRVHELREITESLTGRLGAVCESLLQRMAGRFIRIALTDMRHEWDVLCNQVMNYVRKIKK